MAKMGTKPIYLRRCNRNCQWEWLHLLPLEPKVAKSQSLSGNGPS